MSLKTLIDWSTKPPTIEIDGVKYKVHEGSALSLALPKTLSRLYNKLKNNSVESSLGDKK